MINNTIIENSVTDVLLVPATKTYAGVGMYFCNTSSSADDLTVYLIPSGAAASDTNTVLKDVSISAKDTLPRRKHATNYAEPWFLKMTKNSI